MKALTAEWVAKAEADWETGFLVFRSRKRPSYDDACFHAQQCAEKYMKALLQEADVAFSKTHDLRALLNMLPVKNEAWEALRPLLVDLSDSAAVFRYPGRTSDKADAKQALATASRVRLLARVQLHLAV